MLEVYRKNKVTIQKENTKIPDIIIENKIEYDEINEKGEKITKYKREKINVTKQVNETKKIIKKNNAEEKVEELRQAFTQIINKE